MRLDQIKTHLATGMFAACPNYMEGLISTVNNGEIAKETIEDISPSHSYDVQDNVAIISIDGATTKKNTWINAMCGGFASYDIISEYVTKAEMDNRVDTILFNIDSPGGEVAGVDEVGEQIFNSSKKTVTFYNNLGASAAIWAFSGTKKRYANQTALIGSIGVMAGYRDSAEDSGVIKLVSKNAQNKDCSLNGDCKQKIQARIDDVETIFYSRVTRNTGLTAQEIAGRFGYGDVVSAEVALEANFIDGITTFDTLLKSLKTKSNTDSGLTVPTASSDELVKINQGADMKFDRENLDETEATFNALVENRATMQGREDSLKIKLENAESALEAKDDEINGLTATHDKKLSEAEGVFKAEMATRGAEAIKVGCDTETAVAMMAATSSDDASKIALGAKTSDGGTSQSDVDAEKVKVQAQANHAIAYAKTLSV